MQKRTLIMLLSSSVLLTACVSSKQAEENAMMLGQLRNQVIDLQAENEGLKRQLQQAQQGRIPSGVVAVSEGTVVSSHANGFEQALTLYRAGDVDGAIQGFQQTLSAPSSPEQALTAQYWLGDAYFTQQNYAQAVDYFAAFIKGMPNDSKVSAAVSKMIQSLNALGRTEEAKVLKEYGASAIQ